MCRWNFPPNLPRLELAANLVFPNPGVTDDALDVVGRAGVHDPRGRLETVGDELEVVEIRRPPVVLRDIVGGHQDRAELAEALGVLLGRGLAGRVGDGGDVTVADEGIENDVGLEGR